MHDRWLLAAGLIAATASFAPQAAPNAVPGPAVDTATQYYDIHGRTVDEILAQMKRKGPAGWAGHTEAQVRYRFTTEPAGAGCRLASYEASLEAQVQLPRWTERDHAAPEVRAWWDRYLASLQNHENGHVRIGLDTASEVERVLRATPPAASCEAVRAEVSRRADPVLKRMQRLQDDYDQRTDHGRRQPLPKAPAAL